MFSLNEDLLSKVLGESLPSYQATSQKDSNLGFGFIFYSFARVLRPSNVVVIGSKAGFSVICFALGLKDNAGTKIKEVECYDTQLSNPEVTGKVFFIDPSYSFDRKDPNNWYGIGFWDNAEKVRAHWKKFGVEKIVDHYKMTSQEFLLSRERPTGVDLLYIDGDHSFEGINHDFNKFYPIMNKNAIILAHDVDPELKHSEPESGGYQAIMELDKDKFEVFRLPIFPGLAIVRKK